MLLIILAAIAVLSIGIVNLGHDSVSDPKILDKLLMSVPYVIGLVFALTGLCILFGWFHWGFVRAPRARRIATATPKAA